MTRVLTAPTPSSAAAAVPLFTPLSGFFIFFPAVFVGSAASVRPTFQRRRAEPPIHTTTTRFFAAQLKV